MLLFAVMMLKFMLRVTFFIFRSDVECGEHGKLIKAEQWVSQFLEKIRVVFVIRLNCREN